MARPRGQKKIDFTHWIGVQQVSLALSSGAVAFNVAAAQHISETWMRFRGNLLVYADATQAPGGLVTIGVGLLVVPEGSGSVATSAPVTNSDASWVYYDIFGIGYEEMVTDVIDVPGISSYRAVIDSKAMRVLRNTEVQLVIENVTNGAAMSVNTLLTGRVLSGS